MIHQLIKEYAPDHLTRLLKIQVQEGGFTTASEKADGCEHPSASSAVGAKPASTNKEAGFTIMETVVAITILLIVVSGIMNLIYQGSTASQYQREQITATYLATDAVEYLRWSRDTWWLQDYADNTFQEWLDGNADQDITDCRTDAGAGNNGPCQIDTRPGVSTAITDCSGGCDPLDYNAGEGYYGYETGSGWSESRYTRTVSVQSQNGNDAAEVTVTVTWPRAGGGTGEVTIREIIYDYTELN